MVVDFILPHAEIGPNDHRKYASRFTIYSIFSDSPKTFKVIVMNGLALIFQENVSDFFLINILKK